MELRKRDAIVRYAAITASFLVCAGVCVVIGILIPPLGFVLGASIGATIGATLGGIISHGVGKGIKKWQEKRALSNDSAASQAQPPSKEEAPHADVAQVADTQGASSKPAEHSRNSASRAEKVNQAFACLRVRRSCSQLAIKASGAPAEEAHGKFSSSPSPRR